MRFSLPRVIHGSVLGGAWGAKEITHETGILLGLFLLFHLGNSPGIDSAAAAAGCRSASFVLHFWRSIMKSCLLMLAVLVMGTVGDVIDDPLDREGPPANQIWRKENFRETQSPQVRPDVPVRFTFRWRSVRWTNRTLTG